MTFIEVLQKQKEERQYVALLSAMINLKHNQPIKSMLMNQTALHTILY